MSRSNRSTHPVRWALALLLLALAASCTLRLVADYDEKIDVAATELQKGMDSQITRLLSIPQTQRTFAASESFYLDYAVGLRSVKIRAESQPRNRISIQQYDAMLNSLETMRNLHKTQGQLGDGFLNTARDEFNLAWRAIIELEQAKKRGS